MVLCIKNKKMLQNLDTNSNNRLEIKSKSKQLLRNILG